MSTVLFMWHYRTAAAGPPYNVNEIIVCSSQ